MIFNLLIFNAFPESTPISLLQINKTQKGEELSNIAQHQGIGILPWFERIPIQYIFFVFYGFD